MAYVIIAAELVASFLMLALFSMGAAFQDEGLRFATPLTKAIDVVMFLVLVLPVFLALVSLSREVRGRPWPLKPPWWFMMFLACGFLTAGLLVAKDELGHAAKQAAADHHRDELVAAARQGDGAKACELVALGVEASNASFGVCRDHIDQASTADERLRRLGFITSGTWLQPGVVPPGEQLWFARTYFTALLEATPGVTAQKPAPTPTFDDLLTAGSSLAGVGRPEVLDHPALCAIVTLLPRFEAYYAARLELASTENPERATYFRSVLHDAHDRAGTCGEAPVP